MLDKVGKRAMVAYLGSVLIVSLDFDPGVSSLVSFSTLDLCLPPPSVAQTGPSRHQEESVSPLVVRCSTKLGREPWLHIWAVF
jgi:hypothetical protein